MPILRFGLAVVAFSSPCLSAASDTIPLKEPTQGVVVPDIAPLARPGVQDREPIKDAAVQAKPAPYVSTLDTFGSTRIDEPTIRKLLGKKLELWLDKGLASDPDSVEIEKQLIETIQSRFGFATAQWSITRYSDPGDLAFHITLDVVEKADVARRTPFYRQPTATLPDPGGLIQKWRQYERVALALIDAGKLEPESDSASCPALSCPFGHRLEELAPYRKIFVDGVGAHASELIKVLAEDSRADYRAAAAYLLAYSKDAKQVVSVLTKQVRDPDPLVRNNALRVLGSVAERRKDLVLQVGPILEAIDYPLVSDRSKALYAVYYTLLNTPRVGDQILKTSVPTLLQLLASGQPDHSRLSHGILRRISGRDFGASDTNSWKNWYIRLPK